MRRAGNSRVSPAGVGDEETVMEAGATLRRAAWRWLVLELRADVIAVQPETETFHLDTKHSPAQSLTM